MDYTQTSFAKKLNLERSTYSKYECGTNDIPLTKLDHISNILDVNIDEMDDWNKAEKLLGTYLKLREKGE